MAAPVDAGRNTTNITSATDPWTINFPGSIAAGDLLILLVRLADGTADSIFNSAGSTSPTWTSLAESNGDPSDDRQGIFYRVADGSEGATGTLDISASRKGAAIVWRITGAGTPLLVAATTGTSTTPNPPVTPSLTGDYLFIWAGGWENEQTSPPTGQPTNYSNPTGANSGTSGAVATNCRVAGATRQRTGLSSQTEDPPTWTISTSDDWIAWTVYIPAGTTNHQGSFTLDISPAIATAVVKETFGGVTLPLTPGIAVNGVRETFGAVTMPIGLAFAVEAIRGAIAGITFPIGLDFSSAAVRETFGAVTMPLTPAIDSAVTKATFGAVTFPLDLTISVDATSSSGGTEQFASITFPLGLTISTDSTRQTFGAITQDLAPTISVGAVRETFGAITVDLSVNLGVVATRETFAAITTALELAIATAVTKETFGAITFPIQYQITTDAFIEGQLVRRYRSLLGVGK